VKVLIIGAYGTFGSRLVRLLKDDPRFTLLIAGRSHEKARAFCQSLAARASLEPCFFDRDGDVAAELGALAPDAAVDASGPFQAYGEDPYRVVRACLAHRIHYLDFADARAFVLGIGEFDDAARAAGITILSGVSTLPALSLAVLRNLARDVTPDSVRIGVAPSPFAGMGLNVIRMIASYAGKPVQRLGAPSYAMTDAQWFTIAPPGALPLRPRRFSLADTPDLTLIPALWPAVKSVWAGAGTEPLIWQRSLNGLALLVRYHLLPSLSGFARLFHWVSNRLVWGEPRGGMFVEARSADGEKCSWHMIADGDSGPFVPAIAASVLLRRMADGTPAVPGARTSAQELELGAFEDVFARLGIVTGVRLRKPTDTALPLYRRLLGTAWDTLPEPIRQLHDGTTSWLASGRATVERGRSPLARIAATLFGFPPETPDVAVTVRFDARDGDEVWTRDFGGRRFASVQQEGDGLMLERFGPFTFAIALLCHENRLNLVVRGWRFLGLSLPRFIAPRGTTYESVDDGRFHFHVEIGFPWTGLIVRYRGWLERA